MLSPLRNKSTSDLQGQSGTALPLLTGRSRANKRRSLDIRPFQMAEVAVSRQMFAHILSLIARLRAPPAPA